MSAAPFAAASAPRMRGSGVVKGLKPSGSGGLPIPPPDARLLLPPLLGPSGCCVRDDGGLLPQMVLRGTACASSAAMRTGATFILLMSAAIVCVSVMLPECVVDICTNHCPMESSDTCAGRHGVELRPYLRQEPLLRPHGVHDLVDGHLAAVACQVVRDALLHVRPAALQRRQHARHAGAGAVRLCQRLCQRPAHGRLLRLL